MDVATFNLSCTGLLVETLGVALLDDVEGRVDKDLDEAQPRLFVELTRDGAVCTVRRDERCQRDARGVRKELRDLWLNTHKRAASVSTACNGRVGVVQTSPILRMFSVRDFSSKPRSLLRPNRMLSPSRR